MEAVYGEKGIKTGKNFKYAQKLLIEGGAEIIIAGCTGIGLILSKKLLDVEILDLLEIVANALIQADLSSKKLK